MTPEQADFIKRARDEAIRANHPFPIMAACEAALESSYGTSLLARQSNNLFGMKQHSHPIYETMNLPTREFIKDRGGWVVVMADFVKYPDWRACFADRLVTLERLSGSYPHYATALAAPDAITYVSEVSATWSTDPYRASKCLAIYREFLKDNPPQQGA